jgi:hypothetical protein
MAQLFQSVSNGQEENTLNEGEASRKHALENLYEVEIQEIGGHEENGGQDECAIQEGVDLLDGGLFSLPFGFQKELIEKLLIADVLYGQGLTVGGCANQNHVLQKAHGPEKDGSFPEGVVLGVKYQVWGFFDGEAQFVLDSSPVDVHSIFLRFIIIQTRLSFEDTPLYISNFLFLFS